MPATAQQHHTDAGPAGRGSSFTFDTPLVEAAPSRNLNAMWRSSVAASPAESGYNAAEAADACVPSPAWNLPRSQRVKVTPSKVPREVKQLMSEPVQPRQVIPGTMDMCLLEPMHRQRQVMHVFV